MFTQKFWYDALERCIATAAQALLACLTVASVAWGEKLQITGIAALAAFLKCLIATRVGADNTAALLPEGPDTEAGYATPDLIVAALCFIVGVILTKIFWC